MHIAAILSLFFALILSSWARLMSGMISTQLIDSFHLSSGMLGYMTGSFSLFAGLCLVPMRLIVHRYGRGALIGLAVFASLIGGVIFTSANLPFGLTLGRSVMGFAFGALLALSHYDTDQMEGERNARLLRRLLFFALPLGAFLASLPTQMLTNLWGWRVLVLVIYAAIVLLLLIAAPLSYEPSLQSEKEWIGAINRVARHPAFRRIAIPTGIACGSFIALQGLWFAVWLQQAYSVGLSEVGILLAISALGIALGQLSQPLIVWLGERIGLSSLSVGIYLYATFVALLALFALGSQVPAWGWWLAIGWGIHTNARILIETLMKTSKYSAASHLLQSAGLIGAFVFEVLIGVIVEFWPSNHLLAYPVSAFQVALGLVACINLVALVWLASRRPKSVDLKL